VPDSYFRSEGVVHNEGKDSISRSANFLLSAANDYHNASPTANYKGKSVAHSDRPPADSIGDLKDKPAWTPPPRGWVKLNTVLLSKPILVEQQRASRQRPFGQSDPGGLQPSPELSRH
jgi:hypothetical protein